MMDIKIEKIKLNHWLNIRRTTLKVLNNKLKNYLNFELTFKNLGKLDKYAIEKLAEILAIPVSNITQEDQIPTFIFNTKEEMEKTKRAISRDGIHFYNYYTMPSPKGYVTPLLIDILCPKEKIPALNNGHLEPAITVSLGPCDINARFEKKINKTTFHKFRINKDPKTNWVVGSSYYEPSYCVHTYSRAEKGSGKILSYTTRSNLESLLGNKLNNNSFRNYTKSIKKINLNRQFLAQDIENKGYSLKEISKKTEIPINKIKNFLSKNNSKLTFKELSKICDLINSDPSKYLDKKFKEDPIGRYYYDYKDSLKTIRSFKSYQVASIASSSRHQDLYGYFIKVENTKKGSVLDLMDTNCSHYLVSKGNVQFHLKQDEKNQKINLKEGDTLWVSAYTFHGFSGKGSLIKISDGQNINYLEKIELANTYNLKNTLSRGRDDMMTWGYDN